MKFSWNLLNKKNMKTRKLGILSLLALVLMSFVVSSCGNDDEGSGGNSKLVGAWGLVKEEELDEDGNVTYTSTYDKMWRILILEKGGTGYELERNSDGSYYNGKGTDNYRWKASGSTLSVDWGDSDGWEDSQILEISSDRLVLQYNGSKEYPDERYRTTYERVDVSGIIGDGEVPGEDDNSNISVSINSATATYGTTAGNTITVSMSVSGISSSDVKSLSVKGGTSSDANGTLYASVGGGQTSGTAKIIAGLKSNTKYYLKAYVITASGKTIYSPIVTVTTKGR